MCSTEEGMLIDVTMRKQVRQGVIDMEGKLIGLSIKVGLREDEHGNMFEANAKLWKEDADLTDTTPLSELHSINLDENGEASIDLYIWYYDRYEKCSQLLGNLTAKYDYNCEWTVEMQ
jgi:hypothetical protein